MKLVTTFILFNLVQINDANVCESDSSCHKTTTTSCKQFKHPSASEKSIFFGVAHGRLGNQLLLYALMYQLQVSLGIRSYVNNECLLYLKKVFTEDSITLPSIEAEFCDTKEIKWTLYREHIKPLLTDKSYRTGQVIYLFPAAKVKTDYTSYRSEKHECKEHKLLQDAYYRSMKKVLNFKPEILERVQEIFVDVAKKVGKDPSDITFITIHNRRTDHLDFVKQRDKKKPLKADYFYNAMDEFREEYDNAVFLFISDDMDWGRKNIKDKHNDLFFVGEGRSDDDFYIGVDLALMAKANNTIITRGTFGMWGASLCPGECHTEYGMTFPQELMYPDDEDLHRELIL